MKKYVALALLTLTTGCATSASGMRQGVLGSDPVSVAEVFVIAFDEMAGCPLNVAQHMQVDRPADACEQKGIPRYVAKIQYPNRD